MSDVDVPAFYPLLLEHRLEAFDESLLVKQHMGFVLNAVGAELIGEGAISFPSDHSRDRIVVTIKKELNDFRCLTIACRAFPAIPDFQGVLDGNGYTISGLFINRPSVEKVGFFSDMNSAYIHDLILVYSGDFF